MCKLYQELFDIHNLKCNGMTTDFCFVYFTKSHKEHPAAKTNQILRFMHQRFKGTLKMWTCNIYRKCKL